MGLNDRLLRGSAAVVAAGALSVGALALLPSAAARVRHDTGKPAPYVFATYNNNGDRTFNQLLGINDSDEIVGYFGSGAKGHPNKGYTVVPPYSQTSYTAENFPGSVQTQVTGLNNSGVTVGFFSHRNTASMSNDNHGFWRSTTGVFHQADFPTSDPASPPVDQLLGINGHGVAVGFYTNKQGFNRSYSFDTVTRKFARILEPGHAGANITATGINLAGFVTGFFAAPHGLTDSFLLAGHKFTAIAFPGASATTAFGLNNRSEVVGAYTIGSGDKAKSHGFTWTKSGGFVTVDDPHGKGTTLVNGVNSAGDLVGFYTDKKGNTDGFLAIPSKTEVMALTLQSMPSGKVTVKTASNGNTVISAKVIGLTPGSEHTVELTSPMGSPTILSPLTANGAGQASGTLLNKTIKLNGASRIVVLNGTDGGPVANEPIAQSGELSGANPGVALTALEVTPGGMSLGTPSGHAVVTYNPVAQKLTITIAASGLTPGLHAAHIHVGSCASQGGVLYMLMDLKADSHGNLNAQTRTILGVNAPLPATGWYLNLHQGDSNTILNNGKPTIAFRPLLCSNF
ncbi:MAG TPA: CHRD domain-containing protein [Streptosporangiaceae bacterium]|nr:CHRD domain-containing protein [Streptosporangiaceae bacterium]